MALKYKLIVSDFDGTLRQSGGGISEENVQAIQQYGKTGGVFALCTGRMMSSILPYAKDLHLKGLVAAYQGAVIEEVESGKILRDVRIPHSEAIDICTFLEEQGYHIHVYDGDVFYSNKDDELLKGYQHVCRVQAELTENMVQTVQNKNIAPHKILVMCAPEQRNAVYSSVAQRYGAKYYVTTSSEYLTEIVSRGCDKGDALAFLSDYYKIPLKETIAIGDNYNDLPMIERAGLGVAVQNAEQALKEAAGFVTRTCDENGVGFVIRKFGLGEQDL